MYPENKSVRRILSVEDDPIIRLLLARLLAPEFEVKTVASYHEALAVAARESFDLVLLDINLGGSHSGFDVLASLRQLSAYRHTAMLACTAMATYQGPAYFREAGFDGYIPKPFSRESLRAGLHAALAAPRRAARCLAA